MNSYERMHRRLKGESVDRPPNFDIFMTFAAHYIDQPLNRYYQDYNVLVDANLAVLQAFDLDIVQAISDPYRETSDFGAEIKFPNNNLPLSHQPLLGTLEDIHDLQSPDPFQGHRMSDRLQAVQRFRTEVGGDVPIMGWVEGALAEAADLRGVSNLLMDLILNPDWVEDLLEICVSTAIAFAKAQVDSGADIIGLGDAIASQISPKMYRRFALPYEQQIFAAVHEMGALARLHICGDTGAIVSDMVESGADIIDLDWMVDMAAAVNRFGNQVSFCGNFDPVAVLLQGTPQLVYNATVNCMQLGGDRSFSAAGCEVPDRTPVANIQAQTKALKDFYV